MIRFKDQVFEDYFIDENTAVITDKNGNVKNQYIKRGRPFVSIHNIKMHVYCIQAHTKWGYKGPKYDVHHIDGNPLNNSLENLKYIDKREHASITLKNRKRQKCQECKYWRYWLKNNT